MKRTLSLILSLIMLLSATSLVNLQAFAASSSFGTAATVVLNKACDGTLTATNKIDYYRMDLEDSGKVDFTYFSHASSFFAVYNSDKHEISKETCMVESEEGTTSRYSYDLTEGTYYVIIIALSSYETGAYNFIANFTGYKEETTDPEPTPAYEDTYDDSEDDDCFDDANKVSIGGSYCGLFTSSDSEDYYRFAVAKATRIRIKFNGDQKIKINVYSASGKLITSEDGTSDSEYVTLKRGVYYIEVVKEGGNCSYKFSLLKVKLVKVKTPDKKVIKKVKAGRKSLKIHWRFAKGVTGYQVQVASTKKFNKNVKSFDFSCKKTVTKLDDLKTMKKGYIRIRAYKVVNGEKIYSAWGKAKLVRIK